MVKIWYMDDDEKTDQREPHMKTIDEYLSLDKLYELTGVEYIEIGDLTNKQNLTKLENLKKDKCYSYEDEINCSKDCLPNYEEKLKSFFQEHLHTDEEIRLPVAGSGYFDVRDKNDNWIRIQVFAGDLIIIPKGIYHRFTLDTNNYIRARRFFKGEPVWTPHNRPADDMECRKEYLTWMEKGF